ncbi:MAG: Plug domain-containing protein, partial [Fibrobacteria bacterium]
MNTHLGTPWGFALAAVCLFAAVTGGIGPAEAAAAEKPATPVVRETVRLQGNLRDTAFAAPAVVRLEVLETGDTLTFPIGAAGGPFEAILPRDTLWNLCFSAPASPNGAPPGRIEKCYEIEYHGVDSAFRADIGGGNATAVVVEAPDTTTARSASAVPDSVEADSTAGTYKSDDAIQLKKVLVRAQRAPKRSLGKSTVSAKLIKRMPGLAEADVIRSIQGLPGVVASSDFSTKIYVRGGASDQNLILLDKAVVYSPVHFFGLFSTFLVEAVDEVNFYKGGFPPEYGNRLSSVLDITSRKGGKDTANTWFQGSSLNISTFASHAHVEGHQG